MSSSVSSTKRKTAVSGTPYSNVCSFSRDMGPISTWYGEESNCPRSRLRHIICGALERGVEKDRAVAS